MCLQGRSDRVRDQLTPRNSLQGTNRQLLIIMNLRLTAMWMRSCQWMGVEKVRKDDTARTFEFLFRFNRVWINSRLLLLLITPHLKSIFHWLKIMQRIQYKILSLTYKSRQYNKPSSISDILTIQPTRSTRSSAVVTLQGPFDQSQQAQNF